MLGHKATGFAHNQLELKLSEHLGLVIPLHFNILFTTLRNTSVNKVRLFFLQKHLFIHDLCSQSSP